MSELEELLAFQLRAYGLPEPEREYRFHPTRRWRFDLAYPASRWAFEVNGGVWSQGRHVRGGGASGDYEKLNEAQLMGWRVLQFTRETIESGEAVQMVERALKGEAVHA